MRSCLHARIGRALWLAPVLVGLSACSSEQGDANGSAGAAAVAGSSATGGGNGATAGAAGGSSAAGSAGASSAGAPSSAGGAAATGGDTSAGGLAQAGAGEGGGSAGGVGGTVAGGAGGASAGAAGALPQGGGGGAGAAGAGNAYSPCPASGTACAILPLGDSITEGYGSSGGGYRVELFRQANQNGKSITFVGSLQNGPASVDNHTFPKNHEGHGGYTIDSGTGHSGISGSITDQAISNYHPNIVLLMIGTNDINGNIDISAAPTRLGKLIDDITTRAPNALVVVATIIPVANDGTNAKVKTYDAALPALVSARAAAGKHVVLLDNYAAFSKDASYKTTLMYDYLHPNDAGYVVLGRAFYGAISALLK